MEKNSNYIFKKTENPITESNILKVEEKLKLKLPKSYKEHLLKYNGGYPEKRYFIFQNQVSRIHYFLAIYDGEFDNFEDTFIRFKVKSKRMLPHIFPIAHDEGGNQICISIGENDYEHIYFWDHEEETNEPSYENMTLIAKSFNDFLNMFIDRPMDF